ncbi:hypothetical protein [Planktothrix pseudagardhii]|uniref:Uncharacterized protein n=1 Tax=Planktothrix pseudagardhii TaxID=132604 RepID=A0A9W4CVI5_9CYAN|nr:hypothetical protein [Planktothrix pseudagardhii]CAD5978862.1 hypothetical protein NO713_04449 [Planktothrix pseudagardhii]
MNQFLPNSKFLNSFLAIVILSIGGMGFLLSPAQAQNRRPTFFEESQDPGERNQGFRNTFLYDALGGIADPLNGTGGVATTVDSLQKVGFDGENAGGQLRSGQQILSPSFDRTNVIIPSSFDRTNVIIPSSRGR